MSLLEGSWSFEKNFGIISPDSPEGVLLNIVGIPTWNSSLNSFGYGGVGETGVTFAVERVIGQKEHDDAGGNSRVIIAKRLGLSGAVGDTTLSQEMAKLVENQDPSVDYAVDNQALEFALGLLETKKVVVVGTKILNLLIAHCEARLRRIDEFRKRYALVTIAVTAEDADATRRKMFAGLLKGKIQTQEQVEQGRIERLPRDVAKFAMAYPWLKYSRELVLSTATTVLFNNTQDRTGAEMDMFAECLLGDIARVHPKLSDFLRL